MLAAAGAAAFGLLVYGIRRKPGIGYAFAAAAVLIAWEMPQIPQLFSVGGNSVYILDVLASAFLVVGIGRIGPLRNNLGAAAWIWLSIGILIGISLMRGIPEFGLGVAVNEFRLFLYPYAALTWTMSLIRFEERRTLSIGRFSLLLGWGLVLVFVFHAARTGLGSAAELIDAGSGLVQTTRPLVSGQALMLLMCATVCLWVWRAEGMRSYMFHAAAFGIVVLIVQQRTVWGVAIMALGFVLVVARGRTKMTIIVAFALAVAFIPFLLASSAVQSFATQLLTSAENSTTYDARTVSWMNLISESQVKGQMSVFFGSPLGSGFGRFEGVNRWVTFAPHNWYLTLYLRIGLLGLSLFLAFVTITLVNAIRRRADMASIAIIVMMIGYGWSYSWLWYSAVFAGWAYIRPAPLSSDRIPGPLHSKTVTFDSHWRVSRSGLQKRSLQKNK